MFGNPGAAAKRRKQVMMRFGSWGGTEESVFETKSAVLRTQMQDQGQSHLSLQPQILNKGKEANSDYGTNQGTRTGTRQQNYNSLSTLRENQGLKESFSHSLLTRNSQTIGAKRSANTSAVTVTVDANPSNSNIYWNQKTPMKTRSILQQQNKQDSIDHEGRFDFNGRLRTSRRSITVMESFKDGQFRTNPLIQEALPKQWEGLQSMRKMIVEMKKDILAPPKEHTIDQKTIEEWINITLNDQEDLQGVPDEAIKKDSRQALSRFGIDRFSLLNAGIPAEEITRLYKTMYVHTEGFVRVIKDISKRLKESNIQNSNLHLSRESIVTAIWKVYQLLLEYVHHTDYKLIITRATEGLKKQVDDLEAQVTSLTSQITNNESKFLGQLHSLMEQNHQMTQKVKRQKEKKQKAVFELRKNLEDHEGEVLLRVQFEDKLNNLHQMHRESQRIQQKATEQYDNLLFKHEEKLLVLAEVAQQLHEEKETVASLIQEKEKLQIALDSALQNAQLRTSQVQDLEDQIASLFEKYQQEQAQVSQLKGALNLEKQRVLSVKEQLRILQLQHDHYRSECEDLQSRGANMGKRLYELEALCLSQTESLNFIKTENEAFTYVKDQKDSEISSCRTLIAELEERLQSKQRELELSQQSSRFLSSEVEELKAQNEEISNQKSELNKARDEMQSYVAKKEKELKQTERRFQDKVEIVEKLNKEREELDKLNTTLKNKVASLELEIKTRRAEFDNQRRLLSDRVSNLDTQLVNAMEGKKTNGEKLVAFQKQIGQQNVEITALKVQDSQQTIKIGHLMLEIEGLNHVNDSLVTSKKELQQTLNKFVGRCESLEHELFAITEVNREMEKTKREQLSDISSTVKRLKHEKDQQTMIIEDVASRCASYVVSLGESRTSMIRIALAMTFIRPSIVYLRDKIVDLAQELEDLKALQLGIQTESENARNAYNFMKQKVNHKEEEIASLEKEVQANKKKSERLQEINSSLLSELQETKERKRGLQSTVTQTSNIEHRDKNLQCQLIQESIVQDTSKDNTKPASQTPTVVNNPQSKYIKSQQVREEKKKVASEAMRDISKVQNELSSKYDLAGLVGGKIAASLSKSPDKNTKTSPVTQHPPIDVIKHQEDSGRLSTLQPSSDKKNYSTTNQEHSNRESNQLHQDIQPLNALRNVVAHHLSSAQKKLKFEFPQYQDDDASSPDNQPSQQFLLKPQLNNAYTFEQNSQLPDRLNPSRVDDSPNKEDQDLLKQIQHFSQVNKDDKTTSRLQSAEKRRKLGETQLEKSRKIRALIRVAYNDK